MHSKHSGKFHPTHFDDSVGEIEQIEEEQCEHDRQQIGKELGQTRFQRRTAKK